MVDIYYYNNNCEYNIKNTINIDFIAIELLSCFILFTFCGIYVLEILQFRKNEKRKRKNEMAMFLILLIVI